MKCFFGPYGGSPGRWSDKVSDYGANAWWFHGFSEEKFEACLKSGLAACVEQATFRADFSEHPELIPTGQDGNPIRYGRLVQGICLSNVDFIDERRQQLADGMKNYRPEGVWLDYLTYAGWFETPSPDLQESCFCPSCMREFCETEGVDATEPGKILENHQEAWTRHKCQRIADLGHQFATIIRDANPDCLVGIYACPWTPQEFDGALTRIFAQDMALLSNFADVITPLIYCNKSGRDDSWGREYMDGAESFIPSSSVVQPILDVLDFPASTLELSLSMHKPSGFQLFGGTEVFESGENGEIFAKAVASISGNDS